MDPGRRIPGGRKTTVNLPVTVAGADWCMVSATVDTGMSFTGRRATATVWVLAGWDLGRTQPSAQCPFTGPEAAMQCATTDGPWNR